MTEKTKTVYFGSGWFTPKQEEAYSKAMEAINKNNTVDRENSYVPLEHQYKGLRVDEHPELLSDKEWSNATFNGDIIGIKTSDVAMFVYIPAEEDIGCGVEIGFAKAINKYVLIVIPDEFWGESINLMSSGGADKFIKMSELAEFDFNRPTFCFYAGDVY